MCVSHLYPFKFCGLDTDRECFIDFMPNPVFRGDYTFVLTEVGGPPSEGAVADDGDVGMLDDQEVDDGAIVLEAASGMVTKHLFRLVNVVADDKHLIVVEVFDE